MVGVGNFLCMQFFSARGNARFFLAMIKLRIFFSSNGALCLSFARFFNVRSFLV